jgi:voltage-gated sodium channel
MFRHSKFFSNITTFIIIFYSLTLGLKTHFQDSNILFIFSVLDIAITIYFAIEIALKLYVEKNTMHFFKDKWNLFDFIVVSISLIPLSAFESIAIVRLLRIFRVLRLITVNENIKKILIALEGAIPAIGNIVILMFIVFYIYAVMGNQFFASLPSGLWSDFSISMLTLFRILTFEDWTDVMYEAMEVYPFSWIFFVSFIIINAFVIFNLFVAVIVDEISKIKDSDIKTTLENENTESIMILQELTNIKNQLTQLQKEVQK